MSTDRKPDRLPVAGSADANGEFVVDARGATGVQTGEGNTQIIYTYGTAGIWTDQVAPPPLVDVSGEITSPYRGLASFEERDAALFFGREAAATQVLERMARHLQEPGPTMVSGVSGAGKSSLLRAGVLPRFRGAGLASAPGSASWPCLVLTPGRAPADELAVRIAAMVGVDATSVQEGLAEDPSRFALLAAQAALYQPDRRIGNDPDGSGSDQRRLVLVIDQFEQLFTQCPDEDHRIAFIAALHAAATARRGREDTPSALVVLVVRADFEARCADYPQLTAVVQNRYLLTAMDRRQLRMAITEPAKKAGGKVDDDLVETLLSEVRTRVPESLSDTARLDSPAGAGILPLLSHALDQAWRSRTSNVLTIADYERTGGIEGAVADSADRAYTRLTPAQQNAARQIFVQLIATGSDGLDTADRVARTELTDGKSDTEARDVEDVLESFATERLLTLAAGTVEISHEVVLNAWPLLRDNWLADTHADRMTRTQLRAAAAEWSRDTHDPSYLYSGSRLEAATRATARADADPVRYPRLSQTEQAFLCASTRARRRRIRRRQGFIALLMVLVVGFATLASIAYTASQNAYGANQNAVHERDLAISGQLIAQSEALGDADPISARVDSLAAWEVDPSAQAHAAMLAAAGLPAISTLASGFGGASEVTFSPKGRILATSGGNGVQLWDVATGRQIRSFSNNHGSNESVVFSPDGKILAVLGDNFGPSAIQLLDVAIGQPAGDSFGGGADGAASIAYSPDGKTLATANNDNTARLWNVATREQIGSPFIGHTLGVKSVAFSPDGKILATSSDDGTTRLWNVATGRAIGAPIPNGAVPNTGPTVVFSPNGKILAGSVSGTVRLWDVATGQQIGSTLSGHTSSVTSVAFSPNGNTLATGSADGTARLWDVAAGQQIGSTLTNQSAAISAITFGSDGKTLATGSDDGTSRLWNTATGQQIGSTLTSQFGQITSLKVSPDGKVLTNASFSASQLWDIASGQQVGHGYNSYTNATVALSPDGKTLAAVDKDDNVQLLDESTGRQVGTFQARPGFLYNNNGNYGIGDNLDVSMRGALFSPNGKTLAIVGTDGAIRFWNVATGQQIANPVVDHASLLAMVAFSPDGTTLATLNSEGEIQLWNVSTGQQIIHPPTGPIGSAAFSPDGKVLATGKADGTAQLWDVATGQHIGSIMSGVSVSPRVAFGPDGKTLAIGNSNGTVRLWNVDYLIDVAQHLCTQVGGLLTPSTWSHYVPLGEPYRKVCP